jgi:NTP pyrophosphatase (non-canonical NTP hydrolase)
LSTVWQARGSEVSDSVADSGSTQQLVRATMARVGGYWRPLAAVARLLEELGELAELLVDPSPEREELASELADVWIITAALADQFLGAVAEPGSLEDPDSNGTPDDQLGALVACAGQIARIVNYYDGPKTPRSLDGWPSLSDAVAELHRALARVARTHRVDLGAAVAGKLRAIAVRDSRRFARAEHDPSTAPCLEQFRGSAPNAWGGGIGEARLWGAPAWSPQPLAANVAAIVPGLISFTRAAPREHLDGYVVSGPVLDSKQAPDEWALAVLNELVAQDPRRSARAAASIDDRAAEPPLATRGPLTIAFNGVPLAASVLSAPQPHILLQLGDIERTHDCRHRAR